MRHLTTADRAALDALDSAIAWGTSQFIRSNLRASWTVQDYVLRGEAIPDELLPERAVMRLSERAREALKGLSSELLRVTDRRQAWFDAFIDTRDMQYRSTYTTAFRLRR